MEAKDIIHELRTQRGLSQEELAEKVFVTRQAVSRRENGNTIPNAETLKLLSKLFDVSINTLLGSPRKQYSNTPSATEQGWRWRYRRTKNSNQNTDQASVKYPMLFVAKSFL